MSEKLNQIFSRIQLLVMDFDGVLTDGYVYVDQDGKETVRCSRKDSLGILMLQKCGVQVVVISKETNPVTQVRCKKIGVECYHSIASGEGKKEILERLIFSLSISLGNVAYVGDDVNDLQVMRIVGLPIAVRDAHPIIKKNSLFVTREVGGNHAIREVCEKIIVAKKLPVTF